MADYREGQTFSLALDQYQGREYRTRSTRTMPTFGRRTFWIRTDLRFGDKDQ
jgi:hypothetical protein